MVYFQRRKGDKLSASTIPYNSSYSASQICILIRSGVYGIHHLEVQLSQAPTALQDNYTDTWQVDESCLTQVVTASCAGQQGSSSSALHHVFSIASS